jgi:hypothetical protein
MIKLTLTEEELLFWSWAIAISLVASLISISGFNKDYSFYALIFLKLILIFLYFFESKIEDPITKFLVFWHNFLKN